MLPGLGECKAKDLAYEPEKPQYSEKKPVFQVMAEQTST